MDVVKITPFNSFHLLFTFCSIKLVYNQQRSAECRYDSLSIKNTPWILANWFKNWYAMTSPVKPNSDQTYLNVSLNKCGLTPQLYK